MKIQFAKFNRRQDRAVTCRGVFRRFSVGVAGMALAGCLAVPTGASAGPANTSEVLDAAGDAVFPYDLYHAPVPPYIDVVRASVSSKQGVFHFELQVNADVPANADPGFTPSVNHLGITFGVLTDRRTAGSPFVFFGQNDVYHFNYLVGALYSVADSGIGLGLGWHGFLIDVSTFTAVEIPLQIHGDTLVFETSAASLGSPVSFDWAVGSECDPVSIPDEKTKSVLLVDYVPDRDTASWSAQ